MIGNMYKEVDDVLGGRGSQKGRKGGMDRFDSLVYCGEADECMWGVEFSDEVHNKVGIIA